MPGRKGEKKTPSGGGPLPGMLNLQLILDLMVADGQTVALAGERPYIRFGEDGRLSGFGGCNRYFGSYGVSGDSISIGKVGSTLMYCQGMMEIEAKFLGTLQRVERYELEPIRLRLFSGDKRNVLRFYVPV